MRHVISVMALGVLLSACAHERTEMDRELALKLVDKAGRVEIIHTGSPMVSVTNTSGATAPTYAPVATVERPLEEANCINSPVYNMNGQLLNYVKNCFGSK